MRDGFHDPSPLAGEGLGRGGHHYIADFVCFEHRIIVEADGSQHAENSRDSVRDSYLNAQGFRVLRYWNYNILTNPEGVLTAILDAAASGNALSENAISMASSHADRTLSLALPRKGGGNDRRSHNNG